MGAGTADAGAPSGSRQSIPGGSTGLPSAAMAADEQLSFLLEPALPAPGDVAPMWPVPRPDAFDSPDHLFEPTWGGHRASRSSARRSARARVTSGSSTRRGLDVASRLPELAGLAVRVNARSAVLDGELVVVDGAGRADDDGLRARLNGHEGRPVALLVFDVLHLDGVWLLGRRSRSGGRRCDASCGRATRSWSCPPIAGEGRALHEAVSAQGIAGVLARRRTSPYLPGVRSRLWRSIAATPPGTPAQAEEAPTDGADEVDGGRASGTGPVLALFRRLPFDDEPDAP